MEAGRRHPSGKLLAERFGVSIGTLRKAIDELAAENILVRHQDAAPMAAHTRNHHFFKFFRILRQDGHKSYPVTELLRFRRVRASAAAREKLELPAGAQVFEFVNLLSLNGDVVMTDEICLPESRFPGLTEAHLRERPSTLYALYQDVFGVNVIGTDERLRAGGGPRAGALAGRAGRRAAAGDPARGVLHNRQPVEWRISRVNTAAYEYLGNQPWGRVPRSACGAPGAPLRTGGAGSVRPGFGRACRDEARFFCLAASWLGADRVPAMRMHLWDGCVGASRQCRAAASKPLASSARMLRHYLIRRRFA